MKTVTELLLPHAGRMDDHFVQGVLDRLGATDSIGPPPGWSDRRRLARLQFRKFRGHRGFVTDYDPPLLTPPSANLKLDKADALSYGLTLQHHVQKLGRIRVNACPWAGHCARVCVLDNGNGRFDSVQRARLAKTQFLVEAPTAFAYLLGYELAEAQMRDGPILFRPNVNSDIQWELLLPSMTEGRFLHYVQLYGYSKNPAILDGDGTLGRAYRVAYSWNEKSNPDAVDAFIARGGAVAVVTDRRKGEYPFGITLGGIWFASADVVDADVSDEWIFRRGVIGDLSAKGKARALARTGSGFIVRRDG